MIETADIKHICEYEVWNNALKKVLLCGEYATCKVDINGKQFRLCENHMVKGAEVL